jgi:hypothetical protein|tara:strand:+ start:27 stop:230 length:204 start_codon:yes stop_codon:yes gene_type:complete
MAEFKLMKKNLIDHFKLINDSTLVGNINTGQALDPERYRLDQKQDFIKMKKLNYSNMINDFLKGKQP